VLDLDARGFFRKAFRVDGRTLDLNEVTAVWLRRPTAATAGPEVVEEGRRQWAEETAKEALTGLYELLDCFWLPARPRVALAAQNKVRQLQLAAELGFRVPRTCITNSPDAFLDFREETEGNLVSKMMGGSVLWKTGGTRLAPFTAPVLRRHAIHAQAVRHAPTIFQAYVPKRVELRITVVGDRIFPVAIDSQASPRTRHDWRHYDNERTAYTAHELPAEVERRCFQLVRELDLSFGAIDMVLTPAGEYVFLEVNPGGQWGWVEELSGAPIAAAVADQLLAGRAREKREGRDACAV
jgi:glutathione synthase/RimK-type ligase-like ATP-grasp enzyme